MLHFNEVARSAGGFGDIGLRSHEGVNRLNCGQRKGNGHDSTRIRNFRMKAPTLLPGQHATLRLATLRLTTLRLTTLWLTTLRLATLRLTTLWLTTLRLAILRLTTLRLTTLRLATLRLQAAPIGPPDGLRAALGSLDTGHHLI
jgi:hypothetical protein